MKVKEMKIGNCQIEIHDDYIVQTEEEKKEILRHLSIIVSNSIAQKMKEEIA